MEGMLFANASTTEAYRDLSTLKARCQRWLRVILQRKLRAKRRAEAHVQRNRKKELIAVLGSREKYEEVASLVRRTQRLRGLLLSQDLSGQLPRPVRDILSSVRLLKVFRSTPSQAPSKEDWGALIQECRSMLQSYQKWQQETKAT